MNHNHDYKETASLYNVSYSQVYSWVKKYEAKEDIKLASLIKEYDKRFNHILGYRRMTSWINHFNQTNY